ncbi:uncharacterized protein LOC115037556 isoform X2 [Echeneis naucrates]|uniref:uncharacterized protein LOC115037556 isoform X2 n=1 Tax=Echeneis naucrates TaxID=173247 RepID=UPI001113AC48|nr:uncharacterized protein LOC115037556 isoform X2 [Echeneis naucrates]
MQSDQQVGESYVVYENEIRHDRQLIADGPNLITRESLFRLTVRCFYPVSGVARLSVERLFRSASPGFGSVKVFEILKDSSNPAPAQDCLHQVSGNDNTPANQIYQSPATGEFLSYPGIRLQPKPGPSHVITVPGTLNTLVSSSKDPQKFPILNLFAETKIVGMHQVPQQVSSHSSPLGSLQEDQNERIESVRARLNKSALALESFSKTLDPSIADQSKSSWDNSAQTLRLQRLKGLKNNAQLSGPVWNQSTLSQSGSVVLNEDLHNLKVDLTFGTREKNHQHEAKHPLSSQGSSGRVVEKANLGDWPAYQPQGLYDPTQASQPGQLLQLSGQSGPDLFSGTSRDKKNIPVHNNNKKAISDSPRETKQSVSNEPTMTERVIQSRTSEMSRSGVQNIRVKPLSRLVSLGHHLDHKPVKQANLLISNPSQYDTDMTAVSNDGKHLRARQLQDRSISNTRQEHFSEKTGFKTPWQGQGIQNAQAKLPQYPVPWVTDLAPNWQGIQEKQVNSGPQQKLIKSVAEKGNGRQESGSPLRNVPQSEGPSKASHSRIRPSPRFLGRLQTNDPSRGQMLQNSESATRRGNDRISDPSFMLQNTTKTPADRRDHDATDTSHGGLNPIAGGAEFMGFHTHSIGSGTPGSALKIPSRSECGYRYGWSVHQGIMRGR